MTMAAIALLIGLAARAERCGGWQVAVDTATACTRVATSARFASTDAAGAQIYKS